LVHEHPHLGSLMGMFLRSDFGCSQVAPDDDRAGYRIYVPRFGCSAFVAA
jgi:hypothetical protein